MQQLTDFVSRAERLDDKRYRRERLINKIMTAISGVFLLGFIATTLIAYVVMMINQVN